MTTVDDTQYDVILEQIRATIVSYGLLDANGHTLAFGGSATGEMPAATAFSTLTSGHVVDATPFLVVMDGQHVGYALDGSNPDPMRLRFSGQIEDAWDFECHIVWPYNLGAGITHYADTRRAIKQMRKLWITTDTLLDTNNAPLCLTVPYGWSSKNYIQFEKGDQAWISARWILRCIEQSVIDYD